MKKTLMAMSLVSVAALSACTPEGEAALSAAGGGAAGLLLASALGANPEWTIAAGLAGAAGGAALYQNSRTGQCAYDAGNGYYRVAPCP